MVKKKEIDETGITLLCDLGNLPVGKRNIVLPAYIRRIVGYKNIQVISPKTGNFDPNVANFLTTDPRYSPYFSIQLENELDVKDKTSNGQTEENAEPTEKAASKPRKRASKKKAAKSSS